MKTLYNLQEKIETALTENPFIEHVSWGTVFDVAPEKTDHFPIAHYWINNLQFQERIWLATFDLWVLAPSPSIDPSNEDDKYLLQELMIPLNDLFLTLHLGDIRDDKFHLNGTPSMQPFTERQAKGFTGWEAQFTVEIPSDFDLDSNG